MPARHTTRGVRFRLWFDDLHHSFRYATPNAVRQFPLQDGIHRKTQVVTFERQVVELHVRVALLNRFSQIGQPQTVAVAASA